jgi:hypothetical protein
MTATATHILEEFRQLAPAEKREVFQAIARETTTPPAPAAQPRKTIADVAGKHRPIPMDDLKDHDRWFAEAIMASKGRHWS